MDVLPKWVLPPTMPSIYESESFTALEMVAKLYGAMQTLIEEYNAFAEKANAAWQTHEKEMSAENELFTTGLRQEFQDFIDVVEMALKGQDTDIAELERYIKDNLGESVSAAVQEMRESGELNEDILSAISDVQNVISGIRRKILAMSGTFRNGTKEYKKDKEYSLCEVTEVTDTYITVTVSGGNHKRTVRLYTAAGVAQSYEITLLSGYGHTRTATYSTTATAKTLANCIVDDVAYTDIDVLRMVGLTFRSLVINYNVAIDESNTCAVTLFVDSNGFSICETMPEGLAGSLVKTMISGNYVTPVTTHGGEMMIFTNPAGTHYYAERIQAAGNTVIKNFNFKGGF